MRKGKIGLALGSGFARGLAHIGVLEVLQREGIPIDMIAGTSAGAVVGALFAQGKDTSSIKELAISLDLKRMASLVDPVLPKAGLIGGKKIKKWLGSIMGSDVKFGDLRIPFACVATDIHTCEEVVIKESSVLEGIRASISIPAIFTVVRWKDRYLVDGALVNPVPVSVLKSMGADFIIAVNVTPTSRETAYQVSRNKAEKLREPNIFSVMIQSIHIVTHSLTRACLEGADIVIHPQVAHINPGDFRRAQECILQGKLAAQASIPKIKELLEVEAY